ncbi:MAG: hypothetical protein R3A52_01860 [Polyangiales bacterium]
MSDVSRLRANLDAEAVELGDLRSLARELDVRLLAAERARLAAGVAVAAAALVPLSLATFARGWIAPTHGALALAQVALAAVAAAAAWRWRAVLLPNRASRGLVAAPLAVLVGAALHLWVGARLGLSVGAAALSSTLTAAAVFVIMGVVVDRRLFVVAATALAATLAGAAWPLAALGLAAAALVVMMGEVAVIFRAISRDAG